MDESTATVLDVGEPGFLDALSAEQATELRSHGTVRMYPRGTALFHQNQVADSVVVLLDGRVKLSCLTEDGKEVVLAVRGPGDLLGELSAIDGKPRSASATTLEAVEAQVLAASEFRRLLEDEPSLAVLILRLVSGRLRDADRKRVEFAAKDSVGRVATRLIELSERFGEQTGEGIRIDLPLSQEELAGWTGSSREAVSKALHTLRELGWIETGRRSFTVCQPDELRRRAA